MTTQPEQWAVELYYQICMMNGDDGKTAALTIQRAFAAREADLVGALAKGGFMMTEPHHVGEHRARKLVIGFQNPDDADDAMQVISAALKSREVSHG